MTQASEALLGGGDGGDQAVPDGHGGAAVAAALREAGVDHLLFLPGGHIAPVLQGAIDAGTPLVGTRRESAAVFVAEAYARCTGRTGVAAVPLDPAACWSTVDFTVRG